MTTVVVLAEALETGRPLPTLREQLDSDRVDALYEAMLCDVCTAIQHGDADLLVNYPDPETLPEGSDPEAELRDLVGPAVEDPDAVRYEVQVGASRAAKIGNAVTHLLESESEETAAAVEPTAPFLRREQIGSAAMKLRSSQVVLGPAPDGRVYYAGFREPIEFEGAYESPALETLTHRATTAGYDVDFLSMLPLLESPRDIETAASLLRARAAAERIVPAKTTAWFAEYEG